VSTTAAPPRLIGDYVLERELGRGAFGVVHRAHHRARPGVPLALKVVEGRGDTDRLLLEPAVLSRLDHPNIVRLEDYFLDGGDLVLVLDFIDGSDLQSLLDEGVTFTQADVRDLLTQVGSALAHAHAQSVIHRDLKPANVLVARRPDGGYRFVLTDFGIGQVRQGIQAEKHTGGTYLYMAPEQLRGRPGPQSDLWALGVVAYRLLTGRLPFPGPTIQELTSQILYGAVKPPSAACPGPVDPELEKAVLRLLDKSLQERTASAEELLRDLGHRGAAAAPPRAAPRAAPRGGEALDRRLGRGIRRRQVLLVLCLAVYLLPGSLLSGALLVAGMMLFYLGQKNGGWLRRGPLLLTVLALVLLVGSNALSYLLPDWDLALDTRAVLSSVPRPGDGRGVGLVGVLFLALPLVTLIASIFLPVVAGALFAGLRRLQRERLLRDLAREEGLGSERYLEALRHSLESRYEDVGLHLKYAEALYARGRLAEAAAEARLLLRQDPYNFGGSLLLASAYHALGLDRECVGLCDSYLGVSGYCFEFSDLRQACARRAGV
jgi:serine/threonine-protein kinase